MKHRANAFVGRAWETRHNETGNNDSAAVSVIAAAAVRNGGRDPPGQHPQLVKPVAEVLPFVRPRRGKGASKAGIQFTGGTGP